MKRAEDDPEYWLAKAAEVRASLANLTDPVSRKHLIAAAESYERLADVMKQRRAANERASSND